jgi:hypothetical protein
MVNNDRASGARVANENYAREIMQLFSVGLEELNDDGSVIKDAAGDPVPTYDQNTIKEFAKVFTGYTYADPANPAAPATKKNGAFYAADMVGLSFDVHVAVKNANAAILSHSDRHFSFGDSIHGRRDNGGIKADFFGEAGAGFNFMRLDFRGSGNQQNVIEGQTFADFCCISDFFEGHDANLLPVGTWLKFAG